MDIILWKIFIGLIGLSIIVIVPYIVGFISDFLIQFLFVGKTFKNSWKAVKEIGPVVFVEGFLALSIIFFMWLIGHLYYVISYN